MFIVPTKKDEVIGFIDDETSSMEYSVESMMGFDEMMSTDTDFNYEMEIAINGIDNLLKIKRTVEKVGVTKALEVMVGDTIQCYDEETAMESIMGKLKSGMHRVWEAIAKMIAWVKDFFSKRFGKFKGYAKALKKRKKDLLTGGKGIQVWKKVDRKEKLKISQNTMKWEDIKATIEGMSKSELLLKWENLDDIANIKSSFLKVTPDSDEDVTTYEVDDMLDDFLETDRDVATVIIVGSLSGHRYRYTEKSPYIKVIDQAIQLANSLGNGKLYVSMQKAMNKVTEKIDKELKKADYSDDEKNNAKTMRNQISAKNKVTKIMLNAIAAAMSSLLAPKVIKLKTT